MQNKLLPKILLWTAAQKKKPADSTPQANKVDLHENNTKTGT